MENLVLSSKLISISRSNGSTKQQQQWTLFLVSLFISFYFSFLKKTQHTPVPCSLVFLFKNEDGLLEAKVSFQPQKPLPQVAPHNLLPRPRFPHSLFPLPVPSDFFCFGIPVSWESDITRRTSDFTCSGRRTCSRTPTCYRTCSPNWRSTVSHWLRWVLLGSYLLTPPYTKIYPREI